jgi:AraC-like DNA-binding protein
MDATQFHSSYREFSPSQPLARDLVCMWTQTVGARSEIAQAVYPDTCIDILLVNNAAPFVVGPWTTPFVSQLAPGTRILGARIRPNSAWRFGLPAADLLNLFAPLDVVWNRNQAMRIAALAEVEDLSARKHAMEQALLQQLSDRRRDPQIDEGIQWLARHPHVRVEQLSRRLGISARQLQRRFANAVGYGPKMFQSVLRFQRLLNLFGQTAPTRSLACAALDAGYSDQAHMTREVRRFSGSAPTALFASAHSALQMSELLNTHLPLIR